MNLTKRIKSKAIELGFDKIGISDPSIELDHLDYYSDWINSGKNGSMQWMERRLDERRDIRKYFPQVQSVISVAINYYSGTTDQVVGSNEYKFSNYAWGMDYHIIVKERLRKLLKYIIDIGLDAKGVLCVDSSPVMEKKWAQQAGIGWQGKNTLLLTEDLGSWVFLGELLLDIKLEYDEPYTRNLCANCTACIDACSVNALSDYVLDASKCISYLTVEHKDEFNASIDLNKWIYGCDTCQQVCPWNIKKATITNETEFQPIVEVQNYSLDDWKNIDNDSFRIIFNSSPVKRIKHQRFARNVNSVNKLGNLVD